MKIFPGYLLPLSHGARWSLAVLLFLLVSPAAPAAEDLKLRDGISFYQDVDSGFPIVAERMDDVSLEADRPVFLFFGAAGDLNTNRQARRVVDLYRKYRSGVKFVVIDVDNPPSVKAREIMKTFYRGYIPYQIVLDRSGKQSWSQIGEVDFKVLQTHMDTVLH